MPTELAELFDESIDCCTIPQGVCELTQNPSNINEEARDKRQLHTCCANSCPIPIITLPSCSIPYTIINGTCYLATYPDPCKPGCMQNTSRSAAIDRDEDDIMVAEEAEDVTNQKYIPYRYGPPKDVNNTTPDPSYESKGEEVLTHVPPIQNDTTKTISNPLETNDNIKHNHGIPANNSNSCYTVPCFSMSPMCTTGLLPNFAVTPETNTAGLFRSSGNGKGGNKIISSMNVLTGSSCDDSCSNQSACMFSYSGNGDGGNKLCSIANYVNGGNLFCHCGNGNGGNCVKSMINLVGKDSGRVLSSFDGPLLEYLCGFKAPVKNQKPIRPTYEIDEDKVAHNNHTGNNFISTNQQDPLQKKDQDDEIKGNMKEKHIVNSSQLSSISDESKTIPKNYTANNSPMLPLSTPNEDWNSTSSEPNDKKSTKYEFSKGQVQQVPHYTENHHQMQNTPKSPRFKPLDKSKFPPDNPEEYGGGIPLWQGY